MIEEITIKFGTELKSTQCSWKSQLYTINAKLSSTCFEIVLMTETLEARFGFLIL